MFDSLKDEKEEEIKILNYAMDKKAKELSDITAKYTALVDTMSAVKGFKPGTTEFDKMQAKINKFESEVGLYKKVI